MTRAPSDGARGKRLTILRIIAKEQKQSGRTPTAEEIARLLAMSVVRVRFHLDAIAREPTEQRRLL